ncbi:MULTISPECIES: hypothetical protein [Rhodococcus]|uniref:hypothetical protein n=1 Tax=Rhodococcus TaxID=1827 RepID=UPI0009040BA9|nr:MULTISPECIES: hypothetical protein [unclassified Rhodococcus (in: high G+C Gram-positive bacteria)]APE09149.1 hypothetical protein BO226_07910 [Rhodococcus sp. 2G]
MTERTVRLAHRTALVFTVVVACTNAALAALGVLTPAAALKVWLAFELSLGILVLIVGALRVRVLRRSGTPWAGVLDELVGRVPATVIRAELRSYRALWFLIRRRRIGVGPDVTTIGYTRGTMSVPIAWLVASVIEIAVVHILVPWEWLRWTLLIVSVYSLLPLVGWLADRVVNPHLLTRDGLVLRSGHQVVAHIDVDNLQRCIPRHRFQPTETSVDGEVLFLPGPDGTNLDLVLAEPVEALLPAFFEHRRRPALVSRFAIHVDDPAAARRVLDAALLA